MKKKLNPIFWLFLAVIAALIVFSLLRHTKGPKNEAHPEWLTDFEAAKTLAQEQNKDLFISFSGSDWCIWCKRLDAEVLSEADFVIPAQQEFVFVLIDFPSDKSGQSPSMQEQNQQLAQQYQVQGFPTVILADKDGIPYVRTGYQEGGARAYLRHISDLQTQRDQSLTDISK